MRAFWHYYRTITGINIAFSAMMAVFSQKAFWFPILFTTFGIGAGILFYNYQFKKQYYFYHNLGYTRQKLALHTFYINLPLAAVILAIIQLF